MKSRFMVATSIAVIAGVGLGQLACHSVVCRDAIGRLFARGHLMALVQGDGIYQEDVDLAIAESRSRRDQNESQIPTDLIFSRLVAMSAALKLAEHEKISERKIERELNLYRAQFRDGKTWTGALRANGLSVRSLRRMIGVDLRARKWLSRQIAPQLQVTIEECRERYQQHPEMYSLPLRLRANHLFLAAPPETPKEIVDLKKEKIEALAKRIRAGENFAAVVALDSEDEATKTRGGDLGFFSADRMPQDFFEATIGLRLGEISKPMRTTLGFHIIQETEIKPARTMAFEEARPEIETELEREKRSRALQKVDVDLRREVRLVAGRFPGPG
jgi:parvulin-like peptidyl-prolyl isomerase